jgi:hypothetical protein
MKKSFLLVCLACCFLLAAADQALPQNKILYSDINSKYSITGPLGIPLGRAAELTVEKIALNTKRGEPVLRVLSVNGVYLKSPAVLGYRMLVVNDRFEPGRTYRIKAYQDGHFTGTPREVLEEVMFQSADYYFEAYLVVYKYLE